MWKTAPVCLIILIVVESGAVGVDEYVHPHYTYSCEENKSIIVRGIKDNGTVWIVDGNCKFQQITVTESKVNINETCLRIYKNETGNEPGTKGVQIRIWDSNHDGKTEPPPPTSTTTAQTPTPAIIGGQRWHTFKLTCEEIPITGVFRVAERQMFLTDVEEKQGERFDVYNVKMTFRKTSDINSEELSQIYTGDEFFMFLQYTGSQKDSYKVMPQNCAAIKGYNVDVSRLNAAGNNEKITLWDHSTCRSDITKNQAIMDDFVFTNDFARAKMYGFHFTQNYDISIICNVSVCLQTSHGSTCTEPVQDPGKNNCPTPPPTQPQPTTTTKSTTKTTTVTQVKNPGAPTTSASSQGQGRTVSPHKRRKRNAEYHAAIIYSDLKQLFFANRKSLLKHINGRNKRQAENNKSTKNSIVIYKTIRVLDTDFDLSGGNCLSPLTIKVYLIIILFKSLF